jgi:multiple sugar transport system permease protein
MKASVAATRHVRAVGQSARKRRGLVWWIGQVLKYLLIILLSVSFIIPLFWMVATSLKTSQQIIAIPPIWIPHPIRWANYAEAWATDKYPLYLFNTIFRYALPVTLLSVFSNVVVAYGFARLRWPGRETLFSILLATMMIPGQVYMVPLYIIYRSLGWVNTYYPLTVPAIFASAYYVFLLRQFFRTIPDELAEAARIDGASEWGILWRIVLPLVRPAVAVIALSTFTGAWNDYMGPLIYISRTELYPFSLALGRLSGTLSQVGAVNKGLFYSYQMAISAIFTIPVIFLFYFAQRTFIEGIKLTGIKG